LWAGSEKGIDKIVLNKEGEFLSVKSYSKDEGFVNMETNINSAIQDSYGNIWFGTASGITKYNPVKDVIDTSHVAPTSHVTGLINVTRDDVMSLSLTSEEALSQSKNIHNGYFKVKGILNKT